MRPRSAPPGARARPSRITAATTFITGCRDLARAHGIGVQMHVAESKVQAVVGLTQLRHDAGRPPAQARPARRRISPPRMRSGSTTTTSRGSPIPAPRRAQSRQQSQARLRARRRPQDARPRHHVRHRHRRLPVVRQSEHVRGDAHWRPSSRACRGPIRGNGCRRRRPSRPRPSAAPARSAWRSRSGRSTPGYKADVVFLDLTSINYVPLNDPLLNVVFCEDGTGVDRVMVGGRMLVEGGKVLGVDMPKLAAEPPTRPSRIWRGQRRRARLRRRRSSRWCSTIASGSRASPITSNAGASTTPDNQGCHLPPWRACALLSASWMCVSNPGGTASTAPPRDDKSLLPIRDLWS